MKKKIIFTSMMALCFAFAVSAQDDHRQDDRRRDDQRKDMHRNDRKVIHHRRHVKKVEERHDDHHPDVRHDQR